MQNKFFQTAAPFYFITLCSSLGCQCGGKTIALKSPGRLPSSKKYQVAVDVVLSEYHMSL